jgi:hypothetical protein
MLFRCPGATQLERPKEPLIHTSLGTLRVGANIEAETLTVENVASMSWLARDGYLWEWNSASARVELLICRPIFNLPPHMKVDDCWSAMWRIQVTAVRANVEFSCLWNPGHQWTGWDLDNGEGHLGLAYDDGHSVVSIGTEDELFLSYRAEHDDWLPRRFLPIVAYASPTFDSGVIDLSEAGIVVRFPGLLAGERLQIQFTTAWAPLDHETSSTWFAVDRAPREILAGGGCDNDGKSAQAPSTV